MSTQRECPSFWALDRLHVGEATPEEQSIITQTLLDCDPCDMIQGQRQQDFSLLHARQGFSSFLEGEFQRHQTLEQERQTTRPTMPKVLISDAPPPSWWDRFLLWQGWGALTAVSGVALLMLALWSPGAELGSSTTQGARTFDTQERPLPTAKSLVKTQGGFMFRALYFQQGSPYPLWLRQNQVLRVGDLIQFSYMTLESRHVMIVGMNNKGQTYIVIPYQAKHSVAIKPGEGKLPSESSFELDNYVGTERFFCFIASKPFTYKEVQKALTRQFLKEERKLSALKQIPGPWLVRSLLIQKRKE